MQGEHMSPHQVRYPERQEGRAHPTIGFLTFGISDEFGNALWNGVADSAQDQGVNLLTFPGQSLNHPHGFEAQANVIYDLASAENVAGLVISSTLCDYFDPEQTLAFFRRFQFLPIVSAGLEVEGIPSVMVDNKSGMRDVMAHLIESHGYQRIAFIRGPEGSQDAVERYLAYADALAEHGLALNPDLVAPGDFRFPSGVAAIDLLQDERLVQYEAVVASNDVMALGALEALQARGIRVPNDVAVVGFDDQEASRICTPPLTTVRHPVYESGKQSVEMLAALLRGRDIPERVTLPTQSVVRQSCGCPSLAVINAGAEHAIPAGEVVKADRVAQRDHILSEMMQALNSRAPTTARDGAQKLLDSFISELGTESSHAFLCALDEVLRRAAETGDEVTAWQEALSSMRRFALHCFAGNEVSSWSEGVWQQARVMIGEEAHRVQAARRYRALEQAALLREVGQAMVTAAKLTELASTLARELPRLGIPSCFLSLYEGRGRFSDRSRLIMAYDENGPIELQPSRKHFASRRLVPAGLLPSDERFTMVIEPLFMRDEQIGFALFEAGPMEGMIYDALRGQLSSALKSVLLTWQIENRALQLQTAAEVSRAAGNILDPDLLVEQVVNLVCDRFDLYYVGLFLVDHDGQWTGEPERWAALRAGTGGAGTKMMEQGHKLEIGGTSMIGACVANKQARIALDVGDEAVRFENPLLPETHSELALPLISRGQAIGALTIQSSLKAAFNNEDIAAYQSMSGQLANAIENARLFKQTQAALKELEATHRRYLAEAWTEYLRTTRKDRYETARPEAMTLGDPVLPEAQQAMQHSGAVVLTGNGVEGESHSAMVAPISLRGATIGVVGIQDDDATRKWTDDEISIVEAIAERMALAAENLRLVDETQLRAARQQLAAEIATRIRESLDVDTVLRTAAHQMGQTLQLDDLTIQLVTEQGGTSNDNGAGDMD